MKIISKNLIFLSLAVLVFSVAIFSPLHAIAYYSCEQYPDYRYCDGKVDNPEPSLGRIVPSSVEKITDKITVTLKGSGFISSSIVKKNGVNSPTVFIDESTLMIDIYASETRNKSEIFLTVYNGEPMGGYSRAITFTIKGNIPATPSATANKEPKKTIEEKLISAFTQEKNTTKSSNSNSSANASDINENYGNNGLVATAFIGGESFMPSGLTQWMIMIFALILIVVLWRYIHHSKEAYMSEPMKHA
ncbi:MAG: hypothetical protein AAB873_03745 [Patescibacteria group bacterium]